MIKTAFQDFYPEDYAVCYGCGRLNESGLKLKSHWNGNTAVARFTPRLEHCSVAGYVYGGLLASLIDCHGTGTAAAHAYRREGREMGNAPWHRYVTAQLNVKYLRPTSLGPELELVARIGEVTERRTQVLVDVLVSNNLCVTGEVWAAPLPRSMQTPIETSP
jgi:acyl-coenzyme A thioesterase PaaI-like protein